MSSSRGSVERHHETTDSRWLAVVAAFVVVGLAFRTQALIIGPLVGRVQADLGMSHGVAGLLSTIPVLCMGLLAPFGPVLAASIGPKLGVATCVTLVAVFGVVRALLPDTVTVLLATVGVGVGMALVGPILPMIVRARPGRSRAMPVPSAATTWTTTHATITIAVITSRPKTAIPTTTITNRCRWPKRLRLKSIAAAGCPAAKMRRSMATNTRS
jgi:CP family cyanate transporter-like MFS transporter